MSPHSRSTTSATSERTKSQFDLALSWKQCLPLLGALGLILGAVSTSLFQGLSEHDRRERECEAGDAKCRLDRECERGDASACSKLAQSYADNHDEYRRWITRGCSLDDAEACSSLGASYYYVDASRAASSYAKACALGRSSACQRLQDRELRAASAAPSPRAASPSHVQAASSQTPVSNAPSSPPAQATGTRVFVNGVELTPQEAGVAQSYPGSYWYDRTSGLWGKEGGPSEGFAQAGLAVRGALREDASRGTTGVLVNGRNITPVELQGLVQLFQVPFPAGRYTLDAGTNFGREGQPPQHNVLRARVAALQASGQAAAGDNFWMTPGGGSGNSDGQDGYMCSQYGASRRCHYFGN